MKLRLGFAVVVAAALGGACDKKAEDVPVQAAPVESAPTQAAEPQAEAPKVEAKAEEKVEAKAEGAQVATAGEHAGCADHAAKAEADEANCPFPEDKAAAAVEGCGSHTPTEAKKNEDGSVHYGTTFSLTEAKPLGSVLTGATDGQELNVRVSGTIEKVCQKKGCWMVVKDGDVEARVIMKDHAFTVPVDAKGKPAQVEGTLKVRVFTEAQVKHLAEDGGEDPTKVSGDKKEFQLTATAVEIGG